MYFSKLNNKESRKRILKYLALIAVICVLMDNLKPRLLKHK